MSMVNDLYESVADMMRVLERLYAANKADYLRRLETRLVLRGMDPDAIDAELHNDERRHGTTTTRSRARRSAQRLSASGTCSCARSAIRP